MGVGSKTGGRKQLTSHHGVAAYCQLLASLSAMRLALCSMLLRSLIRLGNGGGDATLLYGRHLS